MGVARASRISWAWSSPLRGAVAAAWIGRSASRFCTAGGARARRRAGLRSLNRPAWVSSARASQGPASRAKSRRRGFCIRQLASQQAPRPAAARANRAGAGSPSAAASCFCNGAAGQIRAVISRVAASNRAAARAPRTSWSDRRQGRSSWQQRCTPRLAAMAIHGVSCRP